MIVELVEDNNIGVVLERTAEDLEAGSSDIVTLILSGGVFDVDVEFGLRVAGLEDCRDSLDVALLVTVPLGD